MTLNDDLIDRLSSEAGRRLSEKARAGRRRAPSAQREGPRRQAPRAGANIALLRHRHP